MDIFSILSSISKIGILAFLAVLGLVIYEIYLLKREKKSKSIPNMPEFNEKKIGSKEFSTFVIKNEEIKPIQKNRQIFVLILIIFLIIFSLSAFIAQKIFGTNSQNNKGIGSSINFIYSQGIKLYDLSWNELKEKEIKDLKSASKIIIGIDKINSNDIDMARIRVNEQSWEEKNTTLNFNNRYNVYYIDYELASGESRLKIEAQLHSKNDGWLGN